MTTAPRRLLFLAPSLRSGGMERLVSILLRGLDRSRYRPELMLLHRIDENLSYRASIPADVPVHDLGKRSRVDAPRIVLRLARAFAGGRYHAAVGFMTYPNLVLLAAGVLAPGSMPIVATEHVTPAALAETPGKRTQLALARGLYRRAARLVVVSDGMRQSFLSSLRLPPDQVRTIYNPYDPELDSLAAAPADHPWLDEGAPVLVAVGRLAPQKGYPVMLEALARVRKEVPARLLVLGSGPELEALQARARELNVAEAVDFMGFVANPFPYMRTANAYILSSHWEGFPFVLVEASRAGAAIVATDCPYGADEVISPGESGLLVPPGNPSALAEAIVRVLREPGLADRLRAGARVRSELFAPSVAIRHYEDVIDEAVNRR